MNNLTSISQKPGWLSASLGDGLVMMNAGSGVYLNLTGTGQRIWELLQAPRTVASICDALVAEYDVQAADIRGEVFAFLEALQNHDAVQCLACGD